MQLQGTQRVDEVLIRVLTAGVRRSVGDPRFWLGHWEPDKAWGHEGRVAAEGHRTVTCLISLGQCTQHVFSLHMDTHTFDCSPHRDNSQRIVILGQEEPTVPLNLPLLPSYYLYHLITTNIALILLFSQPVKCVVTLSRMSKIYLLGFYRVTLSLQCTAWSHAKRLEATMTHMVEESLYNCLESGRLCMF